MKYDVLMVGPVSLDVNIDCKDNEWKELGGAVVASGFAASAIGVKAAVFTKANLSQVDINRRFEEAKLDVYCKESENTCSIQNKYYTEDKEKRICTCLGSCDQITFDEISDISTKLYHFEGLMVGDLDEEMIVEASKRGKVAVDVQGFLRYVTDSSEMLFKDWVNKKKLFPYIDYLKTDAAEASILTEEKDRYKAAKKLYDMGAREVMISHNTEIIVYDGKQFYTCPIKARNLSGRTGRGDTCFAGYINNRSDMAMDEALRFATAMVSLKMETPGPFKGSRQDVEAYINKFYI